MISWFCYLSLKFCIFSQCLQKRFGLSEFKKEQWEAIRVLMYDKRDCCIIASTGYGKSLIYQFPAVFENKLVVVLSPLISLMQDQVCGLQRVGVAACFFGTGQKDKSLRMADHNIVYITSEYLSGSGLSQLKAVEDKILFFAVDESHLISQWSDFRPTLKKLGDIREKFANVPIIALTATAPDYVKDIIVKTLKLKPNYHFLKTDLDRPNLEFSICRKRGSFITEVLPLLRNLREGSAVVYCMSKAETNEIAFALQNIGIPCSAYHSEVNRETRKMIVEDFRRDKLKVVICTIAFGLGIDKPDIRLVVHYCVCKSIEAYYQEAGRAGRDGKSSKCILFHCEQDLNVLRRFVNRSTDATAEDKALQHSLIERFSKFLHSKACRRLEILNYLGTNEKELSRMTIREDCCDNCKSQLKVGIPLKLKYLDINDDGTYDFTDDARILLNSVHPMLTRVKIVENVVGDFPSVLDYRFFNLETFGLGQQKPKGYWSCLLSLLITKGFLFTSANTLVLDDAAKYFLRLKEREMIIVPSHDIAEYFKPRVGVEFYWEGKVIKSREIQAVKPMEVEEIFYSEEIDDSWLDEACLKIEANDASMRDEEELDARVLSACLKVEANDASMRDEDAGLLSACLKIEAEDQARSPKPSSSKVCGNVSSKAITQKEQEEIDSLQFLIFNDDDDDDDDWNGKSLKRSMEIKKDEARKKRKIYEQALSMNKKRI